MTWTVYALREPGLVEARYVGLTQALRNRASQHRTMWRRMPQPSEFAAWLRASNFDLVELSGHDTEKDARAAERQAVRTLSALGHRLFNHWLLPADKRVPRRSIPITRAPSQRVPKVPGAFRGSGDGGAYSNLSIVGARYSGFDRAGGPEMAFLRPSGVNADGRPMLCTDSFDHTAAKVSNGAPHSAASQVSA